MTSFLHIGGPVDGQRQDIGLKETLCKFRVVDKCRYRRDVVVNQNVYVAEDLTTDQAVNILVDNYSSNKRTTE